MGITHVSELSVVPTTGKVVIVVWNGNKAPCKKFKNNYSQAVNILENQDNPPVGGSYFDIEITDEVRNTLVIRAMPCGIVYVDGVEKARFEGHWMTQFTIHDIILGGFNK